MKTLFVIVAAAAVAAAIALPASAQAPYPGAKAPIAVYADTVSGATGAVKAARGCTQYSNWRRGQRVVFRVWAVDSGTGQALGADSAAYAYVKIPGQPNLKLNWGPHGAVGAKVNFWSAGWTVPADYPLGVVAFKVVLKTDDGRFGTYVQPPIASAQMTVIP